MSSLYSFTMKDIDGNDYSFEQLKNKVVLIVNTASKCGFTPQYEELQRLYEKHKDMNFEILGFPSNDFGFQDPGTNAEIKDFCIRNYGVDFQMMEKIHVRGRNQNELYKYLVKGDGVKEYSGSIKWNFTKFLINKSGNIVGRFSPDTKPRSIEESMLKLL